MIVIVDILVMIVSLFEDKMLAFEIDESGEQCRLGRRLGVVLGLSGGRAKAMMVVWKKGRQKGELVDLGSLALLYVLDPESRGEPWANPQIAGRLYCFMSPVSPRPGPRYRN